MSELARLAGLAWSTKMTLQPDIQTHTQSPQASWSAGGCRERLGVNGIVTVVNGS